MSQDAPGRLSRPVPPQVAALGRALLDDLEPLTDRLVDAIVAEDPSYARPDRLPRADLRSSCAANLAQVLGTLVGDADPAQPATLAAPRATGSRRAQQGVPLESVLHAYRLGHRCIWEAMVERAGAGGDVQALVQAATVVWEVVDLFSSAVADAYRRTEQELLRRSAGRRDALVDALLDGRGADRAVLGDATAVLDLPEHGPYAVVVLSGTDPGRRAASAVGAAGLRAVWRVRADTEVALVHLGAAPLHELTSALRLDGVCGGVSPAVDALADVDRAHRAAALALQTLARGESGVVELDERLPAALVAASPQLGTRLVHQVLGGLLPLADGERDLLVDTLRTWLDTGGSAARTAERLYCHRNTVLNRLHRLEALTGRSTEQAGDLVQLRLAVLALDLLGTPAGPAPLT